MKYYRFEKIGWNKCSYYDNMVPKYDGFVDNPSIEATKYLYKMLLINIILPSLFQLGAMGPFDYL